MDIREKLKSGFVFCDGGTGTALQAQGLGAGEQPERWNVLYPDRITALHLGYFRAGADVVVTNTFGANGLSFPESGAESLEAVVTAAVRCAKAAAEQAAREMPEREFYVALDLGPTGRLLEPVGDLPFEEAVELFAQVVRFGAAAGADLVSIETMGDSLEVRAAVTAVRENCSLPVFVTTAYNAAGRLLSGSTPEVMAALLQAMGVTAFGLNCGLGPKEMLPLVRRLYAASHLPVIANPNAGLPIVENGVTRFPVGPEEFAQEMRAVMAAGARVIGGCCGTGYAHIAELHQAAAETAPVPIGGCRQPVAASRSAAVPLTAETVIGAVTCADADDAFDEAMDAMDDGAEIICVSVPAGADEGQRLDALAGELQTMITAPLMLRAGDVSALEAAVRHYNGVALVSLTEWTETAVRALCALAARYGAVAAVPEAWLPAAEAAAAETGLNAWNVYPLGALA